MRALLILAVVALAGSPLSAQPTLRATAFAGGAADVAGGTWRVRGTVGQAVAGRVSRRQYVLEQGLWPAARSRSPLQIALFPEMSPTVVVAGDKLPYRAEFTVSPNGPSEFQYWAVNTFPDGSSRTVLGPINLLLTPPAAESVWLTQVVDAGTPAGAQTYTMYAGTHPSVVLATGQFPFTVLPAGPIGTLADASTVGRDGRLPATLDRPRTSSEHAGPWLAFDADGRLLQPGDVMDLRPDSAVAAKDGPDTMGPEDAQSTVADLPTVVTLGPPHPNPTHTSSTVRFGLPVAGSVRLVVYDALGRRVADLADGVHGAGWHTASVATGGLAGGVYLIRLEAGDQSAVRRLTVVR